MSADTTIFDAALAAQRDGRLAEAARLYELVLADAPADATALYNLGLVRLDEGRIADAAALFRRAIAAGPASALAHTALGMALQRLERPDEAIAAYRAAIALDPRDAHAYVNLGATLAALDREVEARAACVMALAIAPGNVAALGNLGNVLKALGRIDDARATYERALARDPRNTLLYYSLAQCHRFAPGDPHLIALEALAPDAAAMTAEARIHLHFALAKAYDDCGDHDRAFDQLLVGNQAKRATIAYDEPAVMTWHALMGAAVTLDRLAACRRAGAGDPSDAPIFIVGMPRAGTTLIEQILASHPLVFGAGEIDDFSQAVAAVGGRPRERHPELAASLSDAALSTLGARYVAALRARARATKPAATRITDKLPLNLGNLGLIHLALPQARIIHVRRDPLDTCWSCFSKLFTRGNAYAYDLGELGRYHRAQAATMVHWRALLPAETLLEVCYEDVVADLETEARRLLAHCGLAWDGACLAFHTTARPVRTASATQVRQPLYRDAVGRAQPYRHRLAPLIAALGDPGET